MTKRYLNTPEEVVQALKEGKTVQMNGMEYGIINNHIVGFDKIIKEIFINPTIRLSEKPYVDEPEPLKLEVGKFYKTRDGRKAWITEYRDTEYVFPFLVAAQKELAIYSVTKEGRLYSEGISGSDLVAPWEE